MAPHRLRRLLQQSAPLVIADGFDVHAGLLGEPADGQVLVHLPLLIPYPGTARILFQTPLRRRVGICGVLVFSIHLPGRTIMPSTDATAYVPLQSAGVRLSYGRSTHRFDSGYTTDDVERILDDLIDAPTLARFAR
jgi:hypothetical protein